MRAGLLELQRHLVGDGEARAAPEHEGRVRPHQPVGERRPVAGERPRELPGQRRHRRAQRRRPRATRRPAPAPPAPRSTKVLVAATLRSGPASQRQRVVAGRRHRRVGDVGDRHRQRPALAGAPHHLDDVRALPRLRDAEADRAVEPQPPPVDRGDRRPDRGDRHPGRAARRHTSGRSPHGRTTRAPPSPAAAGRPPASPPPPPPRARASPRGTAPPPPGSPRPRRSSGSRRHARPSFLLGRDPQLGREIVGVAAIERPGELDDPPRGQVGDPLDPERRRARRHLEQRRVAPPRGSPPRCAAPPAPAAARARRAPRRARPRPPRVGQDRRRQRRPLDGERHARRPSAPARAAPPGRARPAPAPSSPRATAPAPPG